MVDNVQYEVLDERCHKTGKLLDHDAVHQQQLWHEVVNVWVMNSKGELLLQLRAPEVELAPGVWDVSVGTHLRPGEEPINAAQRALRDTFQMEVSPDELKHLFNIQCANPMPDGSLHKVLGHVFLIQKDFDIDHAQIDTSKISKLAWVPLEVFMAEIGSSDTKNQYFPRANNYYSQLFTAFQAWL